MRLPFSGSLINDPNWTSVVHYSYIGQKGCDLLLITYVMDGEGSFICQRYKSIPDTNIVTTREKLKFVNGRTIDNDKVIIAPSAPRTIDGEWSQLLPQLELQSTPTELELLNVTYPLMN